MGRTILIVAFILVVVAIGGVIGLANAHLAPPTETVQQAIPDDRIPH